jgi:hypothetical protein
MLLAMSALLTFKNCLLPFFKQLGGKPSSISNPKPFVG